MVFRANNLYSRLPKLGIIVSAVFGLHCPSALAHPREVVAGEYLLKTVQSITAQDDDRANRNSERLASRGKVILDFDGIKTRVVSLTEGVVETSESDPTSRNQRKHYAIYDPAKVQSDCAALVRLNPTVINCEPNFVYRAAVVPNDPGLSGLWAMNRISAPAGWESTTGSKSVVVAVIDSGIDYTHPDLRANMWVNPDEIADNGIDDDNDGYIDDVYGVNTYADSGDPADDNGHGTHCAGTVGGVGNNGVGIVGLNWTVSLMAGKFLGSDGSGSNAGAIEAIAYAVDHGANVISASWGGEDYSLELYDAINYAKQHGVLFVTAAGNDSNNNDREPFYPASFHLLNIIAVAATDSHDRLASFSNYGANSVNVGAPGVGIRSTVPGGYAELSGTSMAAPHVAGLAALIKSAYPTMSLSEIRSRILNGDSISALDRITTSGKRINVEKALLSPASGSNGASIISLIGSRGTNTLYAGKQFSVALSGGVGETSAFTIKFLSNLNKVIGKCTLGPMTFDQDGALSFTGTLKLDGSLAKISTRATLTVGHSSAKRRIHLNGKSGRSSRSLVVSTMRTQQDLKRTCRDISASLVQD